MKSAAQLLKNTFLLAASSILLRLCALWFQAYLAAEVGAKELGIFGIIASVGVVFSTIGISGVRFSVTRLVAENIGSDNPCPHALMRCAFLYASFFGLFSGSMMYLLSPVISRHWVMNISSVPALKIMALSMPLTAIGSVIEGYFTAKQKVMRLVITQVSAQLLRITFVAICFSAFAAEKINSSVILSTGYVVAETVFSLVMIALYFFESRKIRDMGKRKNTFGTLCKIAMPLAVSAYMRTGLSSLGQVIIPRGLRLAGMGSDAAFTTYGIITQMALPVIMFPAALLIALADVLVPRLTAAQVKKQKIGISYIVNRSLRIGMIFSFGIAGAMLFYSQMLGEAIYKSTEAGLYIRIFAPLIPIIYVDCVTDGCLKGLNQQLHSMIYNVLEGVLNVVLLLLLLPRAAIIGYIAVMYIKEIFNAVLSLWRLSKVTCLERNFSAMLCVVLSVCGAYISANIVIPSGGVVSVIMTYCIFYVALLYVSSTVTREDIKWAASLANPKKI